MELITPSLGLLVWTTVIFLTVLFILAKFAWKPIVGALREREKFIEDALSAAEKAKLEMAQLKDDNEKLLQEARVEREKILKDAKTVAANIVNEAKDKASVEAAKLVEDARVQITNQKNAAMSELKNLVATTSVEIAEMIIKKNLSDKGAQNELIEQYLKESKFN